MGPKRVQALISTHLITSANLKFFFRHLGMTSEKMTGLQSRDFRALLIKPNTYLFLEITKMHWKLT